MAQTSTAPQVALRLTDDLRERLEAATAPYAQPNVPMTHTDRVRLALENGIALLQAAAELARRTGVAPGVAVAHILGSAPAPGTDQAEPSPKTTVFSGPDSSGGRRATGRPLKMGRRRTPRGG